MLLQMIIMMMMMMMIIIIIIVISMGILINHSLRVFGETEAFLKRIHLIPDTTVS
jgi:hypothetical protein